MVKERRQPILRVETSDLTQPNHVVGSGSALQATNGFPAPAMIMHNTSLLLTSRKTDVTLTIH